MSKASQIVILCEDRAHELFAKRFLTKVWKVKHRAIRVLPYPNGIGSGKKYVKDTLSREVEALRRRRASTILVVLQDADEFTVDRIKSGLDSELRSPRGDDEPIVYIIPRWHIQTWLAYLDGRNVDETNKELYQSAYGKISESKDAHVFIDKLASDCRNNNQLVSPPESLVAACAEFDRIRGAL